MSSDEKYCGDWIENGTILDDAHFLALEWIAQSTARHYGMSHKLVRFEFAHYEGDLLGRVKPKDADIENCVLMSMVLAPGEPQATAESIRQAYAGGTIIYGTKSTSVIPGAPA